MDEIERNNRNQHEKAAELGEYKKLHGCVSPMFMTPDSNQEVHRDQHQFPRKVKEEEIHRQEHTGNSCENPQEIQMEESHRIRDLRPGGEYGHNAERKSQHQQQEAQPVQCQMEVNSELRHPGPIQFLKPGVRRRACITGPEDQHNKEICENGENRDPTAKSRTHRRRSPCQHAPGDENDNDPKENHRKSAIAMNNTDPAAIPAAYQRILPV